MKAFGHLWTLVSSHCLRWISHGHQGMPLLDAIGHSAIVLVNPSRPTFSDTSVLYVEEGCSPWEMQNAKSDREKHPWDAFHDPLSPTAPHLLNFPIVPPNGNRAFNTWALRGLWQILELTHSRSQQRKPSVRRREDVHSHVRISFNFPAVVQCLQEYPNLLQPLSWVRIPLFTMDPQWKRCLADPTLALSTICLQHSHVETQDEITHAYIPTVQ